MWSSSALLVPALYTDWRAIPAAAAMSVIDVAV